MAFDNLCKYLAEQHPDRFATWLLGESTSSVQVLKTELSLEPIRADAITFLQTQGRILHLEFQTTLASDPPLPLRMLDYWVRLHRQYRLPISQILILLCQPSAGTKIETAFSLGTTHHEYQVVKLWEQDPELFLNDPALLPLATLASAEAPEQLLNRVAAQLSKIESDEERQNLSACVQLSR